MMGIESYCPAYILDQFRSIEFEDFCIEIEGDNSIVLSTLEINLNHTWKIAEKPPECMDYFATDIKLQ